MIFGEHDGKTLSQLEAVAADAEHVALMADGHIGYYMPIGGVAAYDNKVSVTGVGVDIACGNKAVRTDLSAEGALDDLEEIADQIAAEIAFGAGRSNQADDAPRDHSLFDSDAWELIPFKQRQSLKGIARNQLGTIGGGNHYVDVFSDEGGRIWLGVHFGSRKLGFTIANGFSSLARGGTFEGGRMKGDPDILDLETTLGQDYWALMELAGAYAYAGRDWVCKKVVSILGGEALEEVHNHHNFAWREEHLGRRVVVVRKGATPAFPGQKGFVGGSMGDVSVILRGNDVESPDQDLALKSTVHGAGRVMGRMEAKGKMNKHGRVTRPGKITQQAMDGWMKRKGVVLRGGDLDEAPQAYRRLPDVLEAQGDTIEVLETLTPLIVCMAPKAGRR
ncbi:MAG: RtcB family protein [Longimicrobiales bacterium]